MRPLDAVRDAFQELLGRKPDQAMPPLDTYSQISAIFAGSVPAMADALGFPTASEGGNARARATIRRRLERYENFRTKSGKQARNPEKNPEQLAELRQAAVDRIEAEREAERKRNPRTLEALLDEARRRGIMVSRFEGDIRISTTESYRKVDNEFLSSAYLDGFGILDDAAAGRWGNCAKGMAHAWGLSYMGYEDGVQWLNVDTLTLRIGR